MSQANIRIFCSIFILLSFISSSYQQGPVIDDEETEGSGMIMQTSEYRRCNKDTLWCWCVDPEGIKIKGSGKYAAFPDCSKYIDPVVEDEELPRARKGTTVKANSQPSTLYSITAAQNSLKTAKQQPMEGSTPTSYSDNKNYTTSSYGGNDEPVNSFSWNSHPGIRIAIICAGVLLALLLIAMTLFIIYRVRKKDEGSYPLTDSHIKTHHGYTKAPTQEFFA